MKESNIDKYIGEVFRGLRDRAGYSLADVAERIGIGKQTYWNYESGRRAMPYMVMLKLGSLYNFDIVAMLEEMIQMMKDGRLVD